MNIFRKWMAHMGYNGKQMSVAGEAMGIGVWRTKALSTGSTDADRRDRLAMAAVAAGIPEWTPENADMIDRIRRAADAVQGKD